MIRYILVGCLSIGLFCSCNSNDASASKQPDSEQLSEATPTEEPVDSVVPTPRSVPASYEATEYTTDYIMGKFDPAKHKDFVVIADQYASRSGMYLRRETYEAFQKMYAAAKADGVNLQIISATRNFEAQKSIWEAKWTGERRVESGENLAETTPDFQERALKILRFSSMPGTSRHHWGTDMDLNNLTDKYFLNGEGKKIYDWLSAHASDYGFCQPYSPKGAERPEGYNEEKWHWSYVPIAQPLTKLAQEKLTNDMISGFKGAEAAAKIKVVEKYVLGINPACK